MSAIVSLVFVAQRRGRLDRRQHARAARMRLDRRLQQSVLSAELVQPLVEVMAVGIGARETVLAFEDVRRPGETRFRQQRRVHALARRVRRMDALDRRAGMIELRQSAAERRDEPQRFGDARRAIAALEQQARRSRRRAEPAAGRRALEPAPEMRRLDRQPDADHVFVAGGDRGEDSVAGETARFADRQRRGDHDAAGMQHGPDMHVVGVDATGVRAC